MAGPEITFDIAVDIAITTVKKDYAESELIEVTATSADSKYTTIPDTLRLVFSIPDGHVVIRSKPGIWSRYEKPQKSHLPWPQDLTLDWPVSTSLDQAYSYAVQHEHGASFEYRSATLRHPRAPGVKNPIYIFQLHGGKYVFVDVKTHEVTVHEGL